MLHRSAKLLNGTKFILFYLENEFTLFNNLIATIRLYGCENGSSAEKVGSLLFKRLFK